MLFISIPDYFDVVKNPIDLSVISAKSYDSISKFKNDIHLMLNNCFLYNNPNSDIYALATKALENQNSSFTFLEKQKLSHDINNLSSEHLPAVIPIISKYMPKSAVKSINFRILMKLN